MKSVDPNPRVPCLPDKSISLVSKDSLPTLVGKKWVPWRCARPTHPFIILRLVTPVSLTGGMSLSWAGAAECPDQNPDLQPWSPGHDRDYHVHISQGRSLLLTSSATVHSITISQGGKLSCPPRHPEPRTWLYLASS